MPRITFMRGRTAAAVTREFDITHRRLTTAALVAAIAVTGLTGCAPEIISTNPPEPAVVETTEPVEIIAGAVVTDEQAATINRDSADNAKAYQLADGTWVIVVKDQPVPDAVAADGAARSKATAEADAVGGVESHDGIVAFPKQYAVETGKRVVHVFNAYMANSANPNGAWLWTVNTIDDGGPCGDPDTCIAKANAWIATQPDASNWTVLVTAH